MRKSNLIPLLMVVFLLQGCVYNSINLVDLIGSNMTFKKGITGIKVEGVEHIVVLRQTNSGKASKTPIPYPDLNLCLSEEEE